VVVVGIKFWIFPFIAVSLISSFGASLITTITLIIVSSSFLRIREYTVSLCYFSKLFLGNLFFIRIFILVIANGVQDGI